MKRFTETQKWDDPWFRRLPIHLKALWGWLTDKCDNAGVIDIDLEIASFQIGYQYPLDTLSQLSDRIVLLPNGKHFIPKFIEFQYGQLSEECKAHRPVFQSLEKNQIKGYTKGIHTLKEKEKDKDTEKDTEKDKSAEKKYPAIVEQLWEAYPKRARSRSSRADTEAAWKSISPKPLAETVLAAIPPWIACADWQKDNGQWIPGLHVWLKKRRWENPPEPFSGQNNQAGITENIPL